MTSKPLFRIILLLNYMLLVGFSFYLDRTTLLFFLSLPWSVFTSAVFIAVNSHSYSDNYAYWLFPGGLINVLIWAGVLSYLANNPKTSIRKFY
jgi:hypothetical protein